MQAEDEKILSRDSSYPETPPQTWGRPLLNISPSDFVRNTPTDVGKTDTRHYFIQRAEKHPHRRGEDLTMNIRTAT